MLVKVLPNFDNSQTNTRCHTTLLAEVTMQRCWTVNLKLFVKQGKDIPSQNSLVG